MKKSVLAQNIKYYRKKAGLTQEKLSQMLGVSCQAVSKWEQGLSYPDIDFIPFLSEILNVSIDKLFFKKVGIGVDNGNGVSNATDHASFDGNKLRIVIYSGKRTLHQSTYDIQTGKMDEAICYEKEFVKRSINPDNITFAASGSQPSGLPWSAVKRRIPKSILLRASNNPSTIEELSDELGIAFSYMEEEVVILHDATLLKKQGDKYITNFFIMDGDCRKEIYHALRKTAAERSRLVREFIDDRITDIRALGIAGEHIDDNTIRWWLTSYLIDYLIENSVKAQNIYDPPKRANGESWGFVGYESTELPEELVLGHNGCGDGKNMFWTYKYGDYFMWNQCGEPNFDEAMFMCNVIRDGRKISEFSNTEKRVWNRINGKYAHTSDDGNMIPDILVFKPETLDKINQLFCEHMSYDILMQNITDLYYKVEEIFKNYSHEVLHKNIGYNVRMELYSARMMIIHDFVKDNILKLPEDTSKSSLGMHIILK